jgi:SsrA-binding protein
MKIEYSSNSLRQRHYVPLALGNGSLSIMVDQEGVQKQQTYCSMTPTIVKAGHRYENKEANLLKYGYFDQEIQGAGKLIYFNQILDLDNALCECICQYESNLEVKTKIFCHSQKDIICISKEFSHPVDYTFKFHTFDGPFLQLKDELETDNKITYSTGNNSCFIKIVCNNLTLNNSFIADYKHSGYSKHIEKCKRKLLMHKKEILKLHQEVNIKGYTLIPLSFYENKGLIKVEVALAKGKHTFDKRESLKEKTSKLEIERFLK